jgi:hypothetical protein
VPELFYCQSELAEDGAKQKEQLFSYKKEWKFITIPPSTGLRLTVVLIAGYFIKKQLKK